MLMNVNDRKLVHVAYPHTMIRTGRLQGLPPVQTQQLHSHQKFNFSRIQGRLAFQNPYLHLRQDHRNLSNEPSPLSPHHLPLTHPTFGLTHRALILMGTLATCHLTLHHRSRRPLHHPHLGPRKRQTYRLSFRSTPTCISQCIMICQALISQRIRHQSHHPPLHHPLLPLV